MSTTTAPNPAFVKRAVDANKEKRESAKAALYEAKIRTDQAWDSLESK